MRVGQGAEAGAELLDEAGRLVGQGQGQQRDGGLGAHRREVGQVHGQRLPAEGRGRHALGEVDALDQRVDGQHDLLALRRLDQRGIVADAQRHVGAGPGALAEAVDEGEFSHARRRATRVPQRRAAPASAGRHSAAARSRTPLTYVCPWSAPKRLAVSMASFSTTR